MWRMDHSGARAEAEKPARRLSAVQVSNNDVHGGAGERDSMKVRFCMHFRD